MSYAETMLPETVAPRALTERQEKFCRCLPSRVGYPNAVRLAAEDAGYNGGAEARGYENLKNPRVIARIQELEGWDDLTLNLHGSRRLHVLLVEGPHELQAQIAWKAKDRRMGAVETKSSSHSVVEGSVTLSEAVKNINREKEILAAERAGVEDAEFTEEPAPVERTKQKQGLPRELRERMAEAAEQYVDD